MNAKKLFKSEQKAAEKALLAIMADDELANSISSDIAKLIDKWYAARLLKLQACSHEKETKNESK